jgi:uncharacterized membrane protein
MNMTKKATKEEMNRIEVSIGKILRIGVVFSAIVMIIGLILFFAKGNSGYRANVYPTSMDQILNGIVQFKPYAILMLGLFFLILTPILRVVVSIYAFAKEHDKQYVVITLIVLVILAIAVFVGHSS